jgi:hypothetical protein
MQFNFSKRIKTMKAGDYVVCTLDKKAVVLVAKLTGKCTPQDLLDVDIYTGADAKYNKYIFPVECFWILPTPVTFEYIATYCGTTLKDLAKNNLFVAVQMEHTKAFYKGTVPLVIERYRGLVSSWVTENPVMVRKTAVPEMLKMSVANRIEHVSEQDESTPTSEVATPSTMDKGLATPPRESSVSTSTSSSSTTSSRAAAKDARHYLRNGEKIYTEIKKVASTWSATYINSPHIKDTLMMDSGRVFSSLSTFAGEHNKEYGLSTRPSGWAACYVLRDGKKITLSDLPRLEVTTPSTASTLEFSAHASPILEISE